MFDPVIRELDIHAELGCPAPLWLRDDDAADRVPALERLVALGQAYRIPMLLAVVPMPATLALGELISSNPLLDAAVHGHRHANHARPGEKSIELGGELDHATVTAQLAQSRARLEDLCGERMTDVLVPPWNRIAPAVTGHLPSLGFTCLSTFGAAHEAEGVGGLTQLNTHLDIIDWKGSRGGRDAGWLVAEFARLLQASRGAGGRAIGVLTHHLVHDDIAWNFLDRLFKATSGHPGAAWRAARDLAAG